MDLAFFFRQRAAFIATFYDTGSQAFTSRINAIEDEVSPWDDPPPGFDPEAGEPPYMEEWTDATDGLQMLGQAAVSLLSDALKMYLEGLRRHGEVDLDANDKRIAKERGFIRAYVAALSRRYGLDPEDQSWAIGMIEQVVLARNLSQHGSCVFHGRWALIPRHRGQPFHASGSLADWFMESGSSRRVKRFHRGGALPQAFSSEGHPVGVVDEPVQDGVGQCRVTNGIMPVFDRELAGDDRGATAVPILKDLEHVPPLR